MFKFRTSQYIFYLAVFLLPSAGFISGFLFILNLIISFYLFRKDFFKDKWNYPFILATFLLIISCLTHKNILNNEWYSWSSWIGLTNWILLFLCFMGFQPYLKSKKQRKFTSYALISGNLPVLISGIGQYFFNWTGPLTLWGGLITWYQKPIINDHGLTALFSNPNYLGAWLNICWPISCALIFESSRFFFYRIISFVLSIFIAAGVFLTDSKNAILALFITIPMFINKSINLYWLFPIFLIFLVFILFIFSSIFPINLDLFFNSIQEGNFFSFFNLEVYGEESRLSIWGTALDFLNQNPLFGFGPDTFPDLYISELEKVQHAHNLYLDLAINYGIPSTLVIFGTIFFLFIKIFLKNSKRSSTENFFKFDSYIENSWLMSGIIFSFTQLFDVQYYDGRISVIYWLILAGLRAQLHEDNLINKS